MDVLLQSDVEILQTKVHALEGKVDAQAKAIDELKELIKPIPRQSLTPVEGDFEVLKGLLQSDKWPAAVEPFLICSTDSDQDKEDRAEGILDLIIDTHLEGLSFLDFGCGEGHVVSHALSQNPKISIGYDVVAASRWKSINDERAVYTTEWEDVQKHSPFDVVLLYDVIDHIASSSDEIITALKRIKSVMAANAKVYVRCHPWCSRHATHLYHQINKAYVHLIFSPEELEQMGYIGTFTHNIIHPMMTYSELFRAGGLRAHRKEKITRSDVEKFFQITPVIANRIKKQWKQSHEKPLRDGKQFPVQTEIQFIDYVLA